MPFLFSFEILVSASADCLQVEPAYRLPPMSLLPGKSCDHIKRALRAMTPVRTREQLPPWSQR